MEIQKFPNRKSIRYTKINYSEPGLYFITICTHNKANIFGSINNSLMILNEYGFIANNCWKEIPEHFPDVKLHSYIIMPNHIHGILEIINGFSVLKEKTLHPHPLQLVQ